jgi:hypothetical protein
VLFSFEDGHSCFEPSGLALKFDNSAFVKVFDVGNGRGEGTCQKFCHYVDDDIDSHACCEFVPLLCFDSMSESFAYIVQFLFEAVRTLRETFSGFKANFVILICPFLFTFPW